MHGYANNTAASTMHYSYMPLGSLHTLHTKLIIQKKVSDKCRFPVAMSYMLFPKKTLYENVNCGVSLGPST